MITTPWAALADHIDPTQPTHPELADPVTLAAHLDPHYVVRPHLRVIGHELAQLLIHRADETAPPTRLILNTPPQVGKSRTAVEWGAFWWLCHRPTDAVVIGCYGEDLAEDRGHGVRRLVERYGARYGLRLEAGTRAKKDWSLTAGGSVRSVGIGSGITGHNADLMFIDDPIRSWADADSLRKRDTTHHWYAADMTTRLSPGAPIVVIQTPWHVDDLRARILAQDGDLNDGGRWRVVVMPALCTDPKHDPLGRAEGEPISHHRIPEDQPTRLLEHWHTVRAGLLANLHVWHALYQCDPKPKEGTLLSWQVLRDRRCYTPDGGGCAEPQTVAVSVDPSGGGRDTAGIIGGYLGVDGRLYFTHDRSGVMPSDAWARAACELAADTGADLIVFEKNYGGDMVTLVIRTAWDALHREQPDRFGSICPRLVPVTSRRGKVLRAEPIAQQWVEGRIVTAAYLPELESEWATWQPGGDSPGRIDASVHLAWRLLPVPASGARVLVGASALAAEVLTPWRS